MELASNLGADVGGGGAALPNPNLLGGLLIAISVLLTLAVHYTLASFVSWYYHRRKA